MSTRLVAVATAFVLGAAGCGGGKKKSEAKSGSDGGGPSGPQVVLDGGGEIQPPPDGAAACADPTCNYQTDEGCPVGTTCRPAITADETGIEPRCQPAGPKGRGEACESWNDCAEGMLCAAGRCRVLCCDGDWAACPEGESCFRPLELIVPPGDAGKPVPSGASVCFPVGGCDVLDGTGCSDGRSCQLVDSRGEVACLPDGTGAVGDPCPCKGGASCIGESCRRLCRAVAGGGEPSCPPAEGICVHFRRDPPGVGECTPR